MPEQNAISSSRSHRPRTKHPKAGGTPATTAEHSCLFVSTCRAVTSREGGFVVGIIAAKLTIGMTPNFEYRVREMKGYKLIRTFLIGNLCGVIMAAAVTLAFTIPANSDYWRMEIWKRGGAAWTSDKNGHLGWKWTVEPISDNPRKKPVVIPSSKTNVRTEQL
jgi:hypothetical protein